MVGQIQRICLDAQKEVQGNGNYHMLSRPTKFPPKTFMPACNFGRNVEALEYIVRFVSQITDKPNILYVGVGQDIPEAGMCASEAIELAARLGECNLNYKMTVVDVFGPALEALKSRETITYNSSPFPGEWQHYLKRAQVVQRVDGARITAPVPSHWKKKINMNDIRFLTSNIVTPSPDVDRYHGAYCLNVLYQVGNPVCAIAALCNMAERLSSGGCLIFDSGENHSDYSTMDRYNYGLHQGLREEIGLSAPTHIATTSCGRPIFLMIKS